MFKIGKIRRRRIMMLAIGVVALIAICVMAMVRVSSLSSIDSELVEIGRLCETNPDSARILVDNCSARYSSNEESVWYIRFLRLKCKVKSNQPFDSDSEAKAIVRHYSDTSDAKQLSDVYYCAGCVYKSLNDYPQAIDYFQMSLSAAKSQGDSVSVALCCYQLGYILSLQGLYKEALTYQKRSLSLHKQEENTQRCVYDYIDLSWTYQNLDSAKEAIGVLTEARKLALEAKDTTSMSEVDSRLASVYYGMGDKTKAKLCLEKCLPYVSNVSASSTYSLAIMVYSDMNEDARAMRYCNWVLDNGNIFGKRYAYYWLAKHSLTTGNTANAASFIDKYKAYADSVEALTAVDASAKASALYNYGLKEAEIAKLQKDNSRKRLIAVLSVVAIIIVILLVAIVLIKVKNRSKEVKQRIRVLESLLANRDIADAISNEEVPCSSDEEELSEADGDYCLMSNDDSGGIKSCAIYKDLLQSARKDNENTFSEWEELQNCLYTEYPNFKTAISSFKEMNDVELKVCLLIKAGIPLARIGYLTNRSQSSIYSICKRLYMKNFNKDAAPKEWYRLIAGIQ